VLTVRDQVIYQALVQAIAEYARPVLTPFYFHAAFGSLLNSHPDSEFFLQPWSKGYERFKELRLKAFRDGYVHQVSFDLAACYDLIDHRVLRGQLIQRYAVPEELIEQLLECLSRWTESPGGLLAGHGLPQGPMASSFLAECILNYFDARHSDHPDHLYFRFVDDMVVMAKSRTLAQTAMAQLDLTTKDLALIGQADKLGITELTSEEHVLGLEPSIFFVDGDRCQSVNDRRHTILKKTLIAISEHELDKSRTSQLKFAIYRAAPDPELVEIAWRLFLDNQHLADLFILYFLQFAGLPDRILLGERLLDYLERDLVFEHPGALALRAASQLLLPDANERLLAAASRFATSRHHELMRIAAIQVMIDCGQSAAVVEMLLPEDGQ